MQEVAITGFGLNKWGKYPDKTVEELAQDAVMDALKDAGMQWSDIEYIVGGIDPYLGLPGQVAGSVFQGKMGYQGIPSTSVFNACATGAYALDIGRSLILSGRVDTVLCYGSFKSPGGFFPTTGNPDDPNNHDAQRFRLVGKTNPTMFAFQAVRRMHLYGTTERDIAQVKVKNSIHGSYNPYARYHKQYTLEEVLESPMVCYPLRMFEIAATSDGAAAIILCSPKKAKQFTSKPVNLVSVHGPQPKYPNMDIGLAPFATQSEISVSSTPEGMERQHEKQICQGSLEQAGIGPEDLDLIECYDLSTAMELDWMEDIGICGPGEAEKLLHDGDTTVGGRIPVNPSGGVSAFGESVPAQALVQVCELVMQLRGVAGKRQVEGAKTGFAVNKGLFHSVSSVICTR